MNKLILNILPTFYRILPIPGWFANRLNNFLRVDVNILTTPLIADCRLGVKVFISNPKDLIQKQLYFQGYFEHKETNILKKYLRRGMSYLDIGANIGWHTLVAAKLVGPTGSVIAFEPVQTTFNQLKNNIRLNKFDFVKVFKLALSDSSGSFPIYPVAANNDGSNSLFSMKLDVQPVEVIQAVVGSEKLDSIGVDVIDFCKIDVEGAELKVIDGLDAVFRRRRIKILMIELNEAALNRGGVSGKQLIGKLKSFGYQIFDIRSGNAVDEFNYPKETNLLCTFDQV